MRRAVLTAVLAALLLGGCADEDGAERASAEFSELAAGGEQAACEFVEPERLDQAGGCRAFLDALTGGAGAEACLQQLEVTRSSASPDGTTVVAFSCGPSRPSDGERQAFGEYELVEEGGEWLIRDGYIRSR